MHINSEAFQSHYHMPDVKTIYTKQWAKSYHAVFSAAAMMNPAYHVKFGYTALWEDAGVTRDLKKMISRFFPTLTEQQLAMKQLGQYKRWQGVRAEP